MSKQGFITLRAANDQDREGIYRLRHDVYAEELHQHNTNARHALIDAVDHSNVYLVAHAEGELAGFISLTPPVRLHSQLKNIFLLINCRPRQRSIVRGTAFDSADALSRNPCRKSAHVCSVALRRSCRGHANHWHGSPGSIASISQSRLPDAGPGNSIRCRDV
jgi:hypothetical protein